jgi:hypothetical protein
MPSSMLTKHNVEQGTEEWLLLRSKLVTASNAGKFLEGGYKAATKQSTFKGNFYSKRGQDLEPEAIELYEQINEVVVQRYGFITNDKYPNCGASPDGMTDKLIEVKCFNANKHLSIEDNSIPFEVMAQIQFGMLITELDECDLILYNPNLDAEDALKIITVEKDDKIHQRFIKLIKDMEM